MKRKSIISVLLLSMMVGVFSTSCQDMLSPDSERHSYTVAEDTLYSYWGILKSLQNIAERYVILNECRGDLVDETSFVSDTIAAIVNFGETTNPDNWKDGACAYLKISDYYHVINSCNAYIANCDTTLKTGTNRSYMVKEYAQVQAIRAWVYMQLLYAYGENRVPFYTEPMLTTDDIYNFVNDKNHPLLTVQLLAEKLGPELEKVEPVELDPSQGMPNYNYYSGVCHSSKCMFPVPVVLGDLYLLSGKYMDAAQHYYNYINTQKCGPLIGSAYYSYGLLDDKKDFPIYSFVDYPYYETGATSRSTESITCIPSSIGKLDGRVLTDINRLFGFQAELSTVNVTVTITKDDEETDETAVVSSVFLTQNYERELIPSKGYETLCDEQTYETYVGDFDDKKGFDWTNCTLEELPGVGDARRSWIYSSRGEQWTFRQGDDILYGKMVSKQNPYGSFSTTYPVVYRKSTVWLRYAEALNRAGFPSYAFAILKTGLCSSPDWFPTRPGEELRNDAQRQLAYPLDYAGRAYDYEVIDTLYFYRDPATYQEPFSYTNPALLPNGWWGANQIHKLADLEAYMADYFQQEYDASQATEEPMEAPRTFDSSNVLWVPAGENAFSNIPSEYSSSACYYLSRSELDRAASTTFLDFKGQSYLDGQSYQQFHVKEPGKLLNSSFRIVRLSNENNRSLSFTVGVHQRGCGFISSELDFDAAKRSSYTYVDMVGKKLKDYGINKTGDDLVNYVYDEANAALVQDAVEDLIIDEAALELAFEGTRFSDLCRVAMRRGDADYLAKRVAKRHTGVIDEALRGRLRNMDTWFLPVPEE